MFRHLQGHHQGGMYEGTGILKQMCLYSERCSYVIHCAILYIEYCTIYPELFKSHKRNKKNHSKANIMRFMM